MAKSADAFRTISEVAEWLDTPAHVLRFWESRFTQVKPVKRAGGRRYYRPADMRLLGGIKKLLHEDGMTIKGAQKLLRTDGIKKVSALSQPLDRADRDAIDLEPIETVDKRTAEVSAEPSPLLSIVAPDEAPPLSEPALVAALDPDPEVALDPEPEATLDPEPEATLDPKPEATPIPEPAPFDAAEPEPEHPEEALPPFTTAAETSEAPQSDVAASSSDADTATPDDASAQLSLIYSRLTALHDRMKANIDPKQQG